MALEMSMRICPAALIEFSLCESNEGREVLDMKSFCGPLSDRIPYFLLGSSGIVCGQPYDTQTGSEMGFGEQISACLCGCEKSEAMVEYCSELSEVLKTSGLEELRSGRTGHETGTPIPENRFRELEAFQGLLPLTGKEGERPG